MFDESKHPRDKDGKFTEKNHLETSSNGKPTNFNNWTDAFNYNDEYKKSEIVNRNRIIKGKPSSASYFDNKLDGVDEKTQARYDELRKQAPKITKDLQKMGLNLIDTEFNVKTASSLKRKIDKVRKERKRFANSSDLEILNSLGDIIRFTHKSNNYDDMVGDTNKIIDEINKSPNYDLIEVDNKWLDKENPYKAIHIAIQDKKTGAEFELQVQSDETLDVKEPRHKIYEKQRLLDKNDPLYEGYRQEMFELSKELINNPPKDIMKLQNYKKEENKK